MDYLKSSNRVEQDLELVAQPGQDPKRRMYRKGYEGFFDLMPIIDDNDRQQSFKTKVSRDLMTMLGNTIVADNWLTEKEQRSAEFARTIIGMESPINYGDLIQEGAEFVVAHWGKSFASPVHGHSPGYMHEAVLKGKIRVNTYRMLDPRSDAVRLVETQVIGEGVFISRYAEPKPYYRKRSVLIHNFVALEPSHTLHYLPEHTRDGRDNQFYPEYFEDVYDLNESDVHQVEPLEVLGLRPGAVVLVRSEGVPEFADHYIVITGPPVIKQNGLRPQDVVFEAPRTAHLLGSYAPNQGLVLLLLDDNAKEAFHQFHNIEVKNGITMPTPVSLSL